MRNLLIDTNIYAHALRGDSEVVTILQKANQIGVCPITIGELLSGFKGGSRERQNIEELGEFLDSPRVLIYPINEETAEFYAEILNNLKAAGKPIPTNDMWIAAVTFHHGLNLFSKDQHFKQIPGLMLIS